jgi:hypothetical protein
VEELLEDKVNEKELELVKLWVKWESEVRGQEIGDHEHIVRLADETGWSLGKDSAVFAESFESLAAFLAPLIEEASNPTVMRVLTNSSAQTAGWLSRCSVQ